MKVISFSLYGTNPIYTIGAVKNSILHKKYFNDWEMRVYHNDSVPGDILNELALNGVRLLNTGEDRGFVGSMWRFYPISDPEVEYFISRDCDSRISERDIVAVQEWLASNKYFHIIRDHPIGHGWPMNAGMWGAKTGYIKNFREAMEAYIAANPRFGDKSLDQCFLRDVIHPVAVKSLFLHDEYFNYEKIGVRIKRDRKLDHFAFIGESIDENDIPRGDQRSPIKNRYRG